MWFSGGDQDFWFDDKENGTIDVKTRGGMICAGDDVLAHVDGGIARCTHAGCGAVQPAGDFADLTSDGVATATQQGSMVRIERTDREPVDVRIEDGERVVGMAVWNDVPTLVVLGASRRLHLAAL